MTLHFSFVVAKRAEGVRHRQKLANHVPRRAGRTRIRMNKKSEVTEEDKWINVQFVIYNLDL